MEIPLARLGRTTTSARLRRGTVPSARLRHDTFPSARLRRDGPIELCATPEPSGPTTPLGRSFLPRRTVPVTVGCDTDG